MQQAIQAIHEPAHSQRGEVSRNAPTGPKTPEGKQRSCQNAWKHGLYSSRILQPGEDQEEYDRFRAELMSAHQPADVTETFLVDELAQNGWRIRRFRSLEAFAVMQDEASGATLQVIHRVLTSAERNFHRSLAALMKLQQQRLSQEEFVSQNRSSSAPKPPSLEPEHYILTRATRAADQSHPCIQRR